MNRIGNPKETYTYMVDWFLKHRKRQFTGEGRICSTCCWNYWLSISIKRKQETSTSVHIHTCMGIFRAALFVFALNWKQSKCLSFGKWRNKKWTVRNQTWTVVHSHNGVLLGNKKGKTNMDVPPSHRANWKKTDSRSHKLHDSIPVTKGKAKAKA